MYIYIMHYKSIINVVQIKYIKSKLGYKVTNIWFIMSGTYYEVMVQTFQIAAA